jgi:PIN domain nuclease of toxin-antitoxin system
MQLLLDTHVFFWSVSVPDNLSSAAKEILLAPENTLWVSPVSLWEMSIKHHIGRWSEVSPFLQETQYRHFLERLQAQELLITARHTTLAGQLEQEHRDPFDRLLVAQAICEQMSLVSKDAVLDSFPITRLW